MNVNSASEVARLFNDNVLDFFYPMVKPAMQKWGKEEAEKHLQTMSGHILGVIDEDDLRCYVYAFYLNKLMPYRTQVDYSKLMESEGGLPDLLFNDDFEGNKEEAQKPPEVFDARKHNPKQDGRILGADEFYAENDKLKAVADNIKEAASKEYKPLPTMKAAQDEAKRKAAEARGETIPSPEEEKKRLEGLEKIKAEAANPIKQKWAIAEQIARKPAEQWSATGEDFELRLMVEYCYKWIKETGSVPNFPENTMEIFWPRENITDQSEKAKERRNSIIERVNKFLAKANNGLEWNPIRDRINGHTNSYRITLYAMALEKAIENYATGYRDNNMLAYPEAFEKHLADAVKTYVQLYSKAHQPIENLGVKPGPIETLDPNYIGYLRLCRKYELPQGSLLHEAKL
jgi:hypothetical protein